MLVQDPGYILHRVGGHDVVFEAANQDTTNATYYYFGYVSASGSWIVQRFHNIGSTIIYEYFSGKLYADYSVLWNVSGVYVGGLTFTSYHLMTVL